jgi:hypothetical protein
MNVVTVIFIDLKILITHGYISILGGTQVPVLLRSQDFSTDLILLAALWP